jgi:putative ABC transport system permease protein
MSRRSRRERELEEELRTHLDMAARDRVERGATPTDAALAARREFGSVALVGEITREMWGWVRLERLILDVRYGVRLLRRSPVFSIVAIVSLAVGISATSAIFSVLSAVRLRALPVPRPHELVEIAPVSLDGARGNFHGWGMSLTNPLWEQLRDHQQALSGMVAYGADEFNIAAGGEAHLVEGLYVSGGYFEVLEIGPERGRMFRPDDDRRGCPVRAVISHRFWRREFGGDDNIVGRTLTLDTARAEIVGVTPASFLGVEVGRGFDVAVPICAQPAIVGGNSLLDSGTDWWLAAMGRLKPGATLAQASAHVHNLSSDIFRATLAPNYPAASAQKYLEMRLRALPAARGVSSVREQYETSLWVLLVFAGLVLLITCANLANLMLARASAREGEIALRLGLGASRGRVIVQLLTESVILASLGAGLGLALAQTIGRTLVAFVHRADSDLVLNVDTDWRVIAFTASLAALTCMLLGLVPAVSATRLGPAAVLRRVGRTLGVRGERPWVRRGLAIAQVAISMVLLFGALLFVRTFHNLSDVDAGFDRANVVMTAIDLRRATVAENRSTAYKQELLARVRSLPGVEAAATTSIVPLSGSSSGNDITFDTAAGRRTVTMLATRVSHGYFETFRIPLAAGRDFDPTRDTMQAPLVVIVNQTLAAMYDGGRAIGQRFRVEATSTAPATDYEIVGVAADSKYLSLRQEPYPGVFYPLSQTPRPNNSLIVAVRSRLDTQALTASLLRSMHELDPNIGVAFRVLETEIARTLVVEQLLATLSSFFGSIAATLAIIGLYGLFAYAVVRRTNEIGIRMSLGASRFEIVRMVLGEAAVLVAIGLVIGAGLALSSGGFVDAFVYGIDAHDPLSVTLAGLLLGGFGVLASYLPARAASRIEPLTALRIE